MVRGPAAVLGLLAAALVYFLVAPSLPEISPADTGLIVASAVGAAAAMVCVAGVVPVSDVPPLLVLVTLGAVTLVIGLAVADAGAAATPIEALAYGAAGALFAIALLAPSLALALPLFVAGLDVVSALAGGPGDVLTGAGAADPGDPLTLELPGWGTGHAAAALELSDVVFAGVFLAYARRYGLRQRATAVGIWAALAGTIALKVLADVTIPALPVMAAVYFVVNADRLPALARLAARD